MIKVVSKTHHIRTAAKSSKWREIGEKTCYFRSKWEANFARYLEYQKKQSLILDWHHEPETFWFESIKRGVRSYLPDFKVNLLDSTHIWYEVKGYMDAKSNTKLKRFKKYYPKEKMVVIGSQWFYDNHNFRHIIKDWE